ncbi:hypothetical protein BC833DRAFT_568442 [Globomyces pollinis-pini]|nr:hypothetical protein BC833DRAFT_568442 [Globomyces pollinis-pini]
MYPVIDQSFTIPAITYSNSALLSSISIKSNNTTSYLLSCLHFLNQHYELLDLMRSCSVETGTVKFIFLEVAKDRLIPWVKYCATFATTQDAVKYFQSHRRDCGTGLVSKLDSFFISLIPKYLMLKPFICHTNPSSKHYLGESTVVSLKSPMEHPYINTIQYPHPLIIWIMQNIHNRM